MGAASWHWNSFFWTLVSKSDCCLRAVWKHFTSFCFLVVVGLRLKESGLAIAILSARSRLPSQARFLPNSLTAILPDRDTGWWLAAAIEASHNDSPSHYSIRLHSRRMFTALSGRNKSLGCLRFSQEAEADGGSGFSISFLPEFTYCTHIHLYCALSPVWT